MYGKYDFKVFCMTELNCTVTIYYRLKNPHILEGILDVNFATGKYIVLHADKINE